MIRTNIDQGISGSIQEEIAGLLKAPRIPRSSEEATLRSFTSALRGMGGGKPTFLAAAFAIDVQSQLSHRFHCKYVINSRN